MDCTCAKESSLRAGLRSRGCSPPLGPGDSDGRPCERALRSGDASSFSSRLRCGEGPTSWSTCLRSLSTSASALMAVSGLMSAALDCRAWPLLSARGGGVCDCPRWCASVRRSASGASRSGLRLLVPPPRVPGGSAFTAAGLGPRPSPRGGDLRPRLRLRSRCGDAAGEASRSLLTGVRLRSEAAGSRLTGSLQTVSSEVVVFRAGYM